MPDNIQQLQKLSKIFNTDNVISSDEMQQILVAIVGILANFKKETTGLNEETKGLINTIVKNINEEHTRILGEVSTHTETHKKDILVRMEKTLAEMKQVAEELMMRKPMDGMPGKDADEKKIVQDVLSQIKIPEYKQTILDTPEQLKDKLETLEGNDRLDAKAIKNLPRGGIGGVGGIRFFENLADVSIPIDYKRQDLLAQYDTTNKRWQNGIAITVSATQPSAPQVGDLWIEIS